MTLPEILKLMRQWWWILLLCPALAVAAAYFISSSMTPIYQSQATVMIEHRMTGGGTDLTAIQVAERRTRTFTELVRTRAVLEPVMLDHNLELSLSEFRRNVSVSHTRDTQLLGISVQDPDPGRAADLANDIAIQFQEYVHLTQNQAVSEPNTTLSGTVAQVQASLEDTRSQIETLEAVASLTEAQQQELERLQTTFQQLEQTHAALLIAEESLTGTASPVGSQVFVVEPAEASGGPVSPRTVLNIGLAGILGMLLASALLVGIAYIDDNIKTEQDVRRVLDRPVLGVVPHQSLPDQMESMHAGNSLSGEIFRGLRTNLQFTMVDRNIRSIVVTSVFPGEGKTTTAANLAIVLAQGGQRVILVDADMRRPRIHGLFHKVRNDRGLSNLLLQSTSTIDNVLQSTAIKNLKVVATGPIPPNPPDLFSSERMKSLVATLEENADIVVFDSPPLAISEALILSSLTDGILFVVRAGKHRTAELVQGAESVAQTGVPILGVVLNGIKTDAHSAYRVYQQYYPLVSGENDLPVTDGKFSWVSRLLGRGA